MTALAVALVLIVVGVLVRWAGLRWLHPVGRELGKDARDAVRESEQVFGLCTATGGRLSTPWTRDGKTFTEDDLRTRLEQVSDQAGDAELTSELNVIKDALRTIWAAGPHIAPRVINNGYEEPLSAAELVAISQQQDATDRGNEAVARARARLTRLERRARILLA